MKRILLALASLSFAAAALAANPVVEMKTSAGTITIELNAEKAPKTVENFLQYVKSGFYNGTIFHRVIDNFMIQGGGFEQNMKEKITRAPIQNEAQNGLKNQIGSIAMARTPNPHSASSQFFINVRDNGFLDYPGQDGWGYAVFGKVTAGMEIVQKISKVQTGRNDVPTTPVIIESVKLLPEQKQTTKE